MMATLISLHGLALEYSIMELFAALLDRAADGNGGDRAAMPCYPFRREIG
jgi:hypothetical protein